MATNADLVDLLLPVSTNYVFGGSRYSIYDTDCSGMVCGAFWQIFGIDPYDLGADTGGIWAKGYLDELWWNTSPDYPWGEMHKGDVLLTSTWSPVFGAGGGSHVGFYTGDPDAPFLSHYCNGGPYITSMTGVYGGREKYFGLMRYMEGDDDMEPVDVWAYKNKDVNGEKDAYRLLTEIYRAIDGGTSSLEYKNKDLNGDADVYQMLTDIRNAMGNLSVGKVEATIDYDRIINGVADKIAQRMQS